MNAGIKFQKNFEINCAIEKKMNLPSSYDMVVSGSCRKYAENFK